MYAANLVASSEYHHCHWILMWHGTAMQTQYDWSSQMHENLLISTSDNECSDTINQQIWVHLCGHAMGVYYIMTIIKMYIQIWVAWISEFCCCQIIICQQLTESLENAWFYCCLRGHSPSIDGEIPLCNWNTSVLTATKEQWATQTLQNELNITGNNLLYFANAKFTDVAYVAKRLIKHINSFQ